MANVASAQEFSVSEGDIHTGYIIKKIDLQYHAKPIIQLENIEYKAVASLPQEAIPSKPDNYDILLGVDRKQPFALIRIPAYSYAENGSALQRISAFELVYEEHAPEQVVTERAASKTTATSSPLATGTWHKISVSKTGIYKIDYNFLATQLGVSGISSSSIRLFGHGGRMLPEANPAGLIEGLTQCAIQVEDGGDGSFDPGDYVLFYAEGTTGWYPSDDGKKLFQKKNYYTDKGYYFLNFDAGGGKRIANQGAAPVGNVSTNTYSGVTLHEQDLANPQSFGKGWWGEEFSNAPGKQNSHSVNLNLGSVTSDSAEYRLHFVNTANQEGNFNVTMNGQSVGSVMIAPTNNYEYAPKALGGTLIWNAPPNATANFQMTYSTADNEGSGWLDYILINSRNTLAFGSTNSFVFSDLNTVGQGNIVNYTVGNAAGAIVWDVTDPQNPIRMNGAANGSSYTFTQNADELHWFIAYKGASFDAPEYLGTIPNQDLYGSGQVDYIIVTYPDFKPAAERLAEFHRNNSGLRVIVATTTQVYNEFSSGSQDISAIRDFARMFYQRAGNNDAEMPRYLLLLGDASYDYKDRIANNTNFVPIFEAAESFDFIGTFSNDDFFGFLDEGEDIERYDIINALDIGVGRIPAKTLQEANGVVDKVIYYKSPATLGPWRLSTMYIADNEDAAGEHMSDAESMNSTVNQNSEIHNATKVYQDALPFISTPGGQRAPEANKMINDGIFKGAFMLNYSGHGSFRVLSHERILTKDDYNKWRNLDAMPFMITATCDFGQFDQPTFVSSGEDIMLKADGGVIATLTTTHLVYSYANEILNREYLAAQFQHINGKWNTFGDAVRIGKNGTYANAASTADVIKNFRKFALLGDPALAPNFPEFFIKTTSVLDGATQQPVTTIGALGEYIINGEVTDVNGNVLDYFDGELSVTIFDKPRKVKTISQVNKTFEVRTNTIYKGKATVTNGKFSFAFIAPKDINYEVGKGRFSYYAHNGKTDAAGRDDSVSVGGFSDNPVIEDNPPIVRPFIKDSLFINGGLTGSNTAIFAILQDETGINVSGNSVGHDLTAVLDEDVSNPYVMNDYYETAPNTYKRGFVYFPVEDIPEGRHRFTVKAWDANNNSGVGHVDFEVAGGQIVKVQSLMNYPNPFRDKTHFVFEHNHPDEDLVAEINIYSTSGVLVRKIRQNFITTGSKSNEVTWDGTDNNGVKIPSGVYIYRMMISTDQGIETTAYQKLVIVR